MSNLEMDEIRKLFFEESFEGLDMMESGLLNLDATSDREVINGIFRAAHSIKGAGATLGFTAVAQFTHGVETLLDEMRNGSRQVTSEAVQLLLATVDCMREMLKAAQTDQPVDELKVSSLDDEIKQMLARPAQGDAAARPSPAPSAAPVAAAAPAAAAGARPDDAPQGPGWIIDFRPHANLFRDCNEPARIFAELAALGEVSVEADVAAVPALGEFDPEECHLAFRILVRGNVDKLRLEEVFDWVDASSRIAYTHLPGAAPATTPAENASSAAPAAEPARAVAAPAAEPATAGTAPRAAAGAAPPVAAKNADSGSIRVSIDKIDQLINLVGELVITQSMLSSFGDPTDGSRIEMLQQGLVQLARNTRELQESVMQIRMLPISVSFNRFPRLVHDLSRKLGKKVELRLTGESTELDKTVLEKISDPLVHLVRNSLDHGIEKPEIRLAAGKPEAGVLELAAFHQGGSIVIEVRDDGAGLNRDKILRKARERGIVSADQELTTEQVQNLIFAPGFSTAEQVSDVSGRGVGMDVVRRNIQDLGGQVQIQSVEGQGSTIRIRLPLTLAILDGQLVRVGKEIYVLSLVSIVETIQITKDRLSTVAGSAEMFRLRQEFLPLVRLHALFDVEPDSRDPCEGLLVVVEADGRRAGLLVDDLLAQQQVVIKSLETNFRQIEGLAGATILGDGQVALIMDVAGVIQRALGDGRAVRAA